MADGPTGTPQPSPGSVDDAAAHAIATADPDRAGIPTGGTAGAD